MNYQVPSILQYDAGQYVEKTVKQIGRYLQCAGAEKVVVGASTGLDSTTVSYLCSKIVGLDNLILVHLPHINQVESISEFNFLCDSLGLSQNNRNVVDIRPMLDAYPHKGSTIQMTNLLTRIQRAVLFDYSHKNNAPLIATMNRTEYELGEFPIFGLEGSIQPIRMLFKTQLQSLGNYLGIPGHFLKKIPTIDTWLGKTDQVNRTRLVEIGMPIVDQILKFNIDNGLSLDDITNKGFNKKDAEFIIWMHEKNKFKQYLPYVPPVKI